MSEHRSGAEKRSPTSALEFSVNWDYRCPFARNAHEHVMAALDAGADWDVTYVAFSLNQAHVEEGQPDVWDDPEKASSLLAMQVGIASKCTELAVAYAKEREQFGKPIGSFQAVKHICADMLVRAEVARAAVHAAGVMLDDTSAGDAARAAAAAKVVADEAAFRNGKDCVQVHGGMGFTWEVDVHLYLKRAAVLSQQFGTASEHAERMFGWL